MVKVIVSGASGFIAQHVVKALLDKQYDVVGTVRSAEKGNHLEKLFTSDKFRYEIVKAIEAPGSFDELLKKHSDAEIFLHTASPFHFNAKDINKELLIPAVEGTKNALKAIKEHGSSIKRVVVTSSFAAVFTLEKESDTSRTLTEDTWNEITHDQALKDPLHGYLGSKKFAELAAWEFVKEENPKFVLSTVLPLYVFGPQAFESEVKEKLNTSSEVINSIIQLKPGDLVPLYESGFIDVRDVAKAHVAAFEREETKNRRLLLNETRFSSQEIVDIIIDNFRQLRDKIAVGKPGSGAGVASRLATIDNSWTKKVLGFKFYDLHDSVVDSVSQILSARRQAHL